MASAAPSLAALRGEARAFARERIAPLAGEIDRTDRLPPDVFRALGERGWTGLGLPTRYGGTGGGTRETAIVLEELARASATVATDLSVHLSVCAAPIARWGSDAQKDRWLPGLADGTTLGAFALTEPGVGSDAAHLATRYERGADGYVLRGSKMFITNGASAGVIVVFATRDPRLGARGISAFLLARGTPGFSVAQHLDKMGLRGSETNELVLDSARLPPAALLGTEGEGLGIALGALMGGRVGIAACALGVAQSAYDLLRAEVAQRPDDGRRAHLARAWTELASARTLVAHAAEEKDAGRPFEIWASTAKLAASTAAVSIAQSAMEAIGPAAVVRGHPAERILRDARVFPIVEGSTEIQERILGKALATDPADGDSRSDA